MRYGLLVFVYVRFYAVRWRPPSLKHSLFLCVEYIKRYATLVPIQYQCQSVPTKCLTPEISSAPHFCNRQENKLYDWTFSRALFCFVRRDGKMRREYVGWFMRVHQTMIFYGRLRKQTFSFYFDDSERNEYWTHESTCLFGNLRTNEIAIDESPLNGCCRPRIIIIINQWNCFAGFALGMVI